MKLLNTAMLSAMLALGTTSLAQAADLRFGHSFAESSLENQAINQFADAVRERTNGEVNIQVFPAGQLGNIGATFSAISLGTIDMTMLDVSLLGYQKGHEEFFVGQVPFLFKTQEGARRVMNSPLFADMYERLRAEKGIRVLAVAGDRAPRALNTTKGPINTPADAEGITIRVLPNPVSIASFEAWGMRPTPLDFGELYLAIRQGVVEGQDNGLDVTVPNNFHEITDYFAELDHVRGIYGWYLSDLTWDRLSEDARQIMLEEAQRAGDLISDQGQKRMDDDRATLIAAGVEVSTPDRAAFEELSKDIYMQFDGSLWREGLVAEILVMQE
jgi:tripartite ATP-independent transporter DctP family solute receptor